MKKGKFVPNGNIEATVERLVAENIKQIELDLPCPKCHNVTHLAFSGDSCKFCGLVIEYGTEPNA